MVDAVCADESVRAPEVRYCEKPHAQWLSYHDGTKEIVLPRPEFAAEYDPDVFQDGRYGLVVLHELAHHIAYERHGQEGHTPFMYAKLFQLCVRYGIEIGWAYENETEYKPRAAKRGWDLFRRWALA